MPKDKIHVKAYVTLYVNQEDKNWWTRLLHNGAVKMSHAELFHKVMESARKRGAITKDEAPK